MTTPNSRPSNSKKETPSGLVVPGEIKLQYAKIPTVRPDLKSVADETRVDIMDLIKEASTETQVSPNLDTLKELSRIGLTAEDCFTPADQLLEQKYEEKNLRMRSSLRLTAGDKKPKDMSVEFGQNNAFVFTSPGVKKPNGLYPENTDGIILSENPGKSITALMISADTHGDIQTASTAAAITTAATVYAANELDLDNDERFPITFDELKKKTDPISEEIGVENTNIEGLMLRLDLNTYFLELSGNTERIQCLVIDPASGSMESYQQVKQERLRENVENSLQKSDFDRLKEAIEKGYSGTKRANMLKKLELVREQGFSREEQDKLIARIPKSKQLSVVIPVSAGDVVVLASDALLRTIKSKGKESGIVAAITEGLAKGKPLNQIASEIMVTMAKKQKDGIDDMQDGSNSLVVFQVP